MRWIGGALYRVSANKLCRTATLGSLTISTRLRVGEEGATGVWGHVRLSLKAYRIMSSPSPPAGRSLASQDLPAYASPGGLSRGSSTRYLARWVGLGRMGGVDGPGGRGQICHDPVIMRKVQSIVGGVIGF